MHVKKSLLCRSSSKMLRTINWKLPAQKKRIFPAIGSTTRVHLYTIVRRWNARNSLDKTYSLLIKGKGKWITLNRLWSSLSNIKENKKKPLIISLNSWLKDRRAVFKLSVAENRNWPLCTRRIFLNEGHHSEILSWRF